MAEDQTTRSKVEGLNQSDIDQEWVLLFSLLLLYSLFYLIYKKRLDWKFIYFLIMEVENSQSTKIYF